MAQRCVQGPQGFGNLDRKEHAVTLEVEMGRGQWLRPAIKTLPVFADVLEWNHGRWQEESAAKCARGSWGSQGQGVDCSLSLRHGLTQPKPSWPQTYHVDEYGLELLTAPLPPPLPPKFWDYRCVITPGFCSTGMEPELRHPKQAIYQLNYIPGLQCGP